MPPPYLLKGVYEKEDDPGRYLKFLEEFRTVLIEHSPTLAQLVKRGFLANSEEFTREGLVCDDIVKFYNLLVDAKQTGDSHLPLLSSTMDDLNKEICLTEQIFDARMK